MWGLTLWLALVSCAILVAKPTLHRDKKAVSLVLHLLTMVPFFALSSRFLVNDTSILHVAAYGGAALPMKYKFAATWAAREGPLLLWVVWMSLLAWIWREPLKGEESHMSNGSMSQKAN